MKNSKLWIRICNIACALLMVALLVFQFMPFWTMPACEVCGVRCELDVNDECEACSITADWCVVPTSCVCTTKCTSKKTALETCPICTEKWRKCVAESRIAETTAEETDAAAENADTTAEEPAEKKDVELVLTPIAPIPEVRKGVQVSIQQYTWLPTFQGCVGVTDYFKSLYNTDTYEFQINDVILMPALTLVLAAFCVFFTLNKSAKIWASLVAFIGGLLATITYLTQPIFQLGAGWQTHLYISIAVLVISAIPVIIGGIGLLRKALNKKK